MKGLVLEVRESTVILMSSNGDYVERPLPSGTVRVGQTVSLEPILEKTPPRWRTAMALAGVLAACVISAAGYGYTQPFGFVNLEINPSFQLTYNGFQQVLDVKAMNPDGEAVLQGQDDFGHQPVTVVIQGLVSDAYDEGFIKPGKQNVVYYAVSSRFSIFDEKPLLQALWDDSLEAGGDVSKVLLEGSPEFYRDIVEQGISPIPELLMRARNSEENPGLFKTEIPIREIGAPAPDPPIQKTIDETQPPNSQAPMEPVPITEQKEGVPQKQKNKVNPSGPAIIAEPTASDIPVVPQSEPPSEATQGTTGESTSGPGGTEPDNGQGQPDSTSGTTEAATQGSSNAPTSAGPGAPESPGEGSPDSPGPGGGSDGSKAPENGSAK